MKLLKKINNNYVLASDSKGRTVIASGKGLGFLKMPCRISDLSCIEHVFYDVVRFHIPGRDPGMLKERDDIPAGS